MGGIVVLFCFVLSLFSVPYIILFLFCFCGFFVFVCPGSRGYICCTFYVLSLHQRTTIFFNGKSIFFYVIVINGTEFMSYSKRQSLGQGERVG